MPVLSCRWASGNFTLAQTNDGGRTGRRRRMRASGRPTSLAAGIARGVHAMGRMPLVAGLLGLAMVSGAHAQLQVRGTVLSSDKYAELAGALEEDGVLGEFADFVNESVELPAPVGIRFAECGQVNAFYDPAAKQISMCLELVEHYVVEMSQEYPDEAAAMTAAEGAFSLVLFHELGHALVDVMDLPITGREEDAVDQLAAWAMIESAADNQAVLDSALSYYRSAERQGGQVSAAEFADEHSLNLQRFYNLVCWVYGSDPGKHAGLVGNVLPEARAARCPSEYAKLDRSWSTLLE